MKIEDNIMTLCCYKYTPNLVVFRYDFNAKEWAILEDRSLSEEEIAECGFYETENK